MASYNELNALIDAYINRNGVQAITGQILNGVLKAMVEQLGRGYTIMGAAIPTTDPGTPDGPECYFASTPGTYTDFDGLQVAPGELALLCYTPTDGWMKATIYEGFQEVGATIDGNVGTPSVGVSYADGVLSFDFHNMKGNTGDPAGFGTVNATVDGNIGTPGVSVQTSGPDTAKNLTFAFTNLKGETGVTSVVATVDNTTGTPACTVSLVGQQLTLAFSGLKGAQGDTGVSADYPIAIVNNLTTNDPASALSAAQGVVLQGEITQLEAKVTGLAITTFTDGYIKTSDGAVGAATNRQYTDYIDVSEIISITFTNPVSTSSSPTWGMVWYDENKARVGSYAATANGSSNGYREVTRNVPRGTKYARFTRWADPTLGDFWIKLKGSYEERIAKLESDEKVTDKTVGAKIVEGSATASTTESTTYINQALGYTIPAGTKVWVEVTGVGGSEDPVSKVRLRSNSISSTPIDIKKSKEVALLEDTTSILVSSLATDVSSAGEVSVVVSWSGLNTEIKRLDGRIDGIVERLDTQLKLSDFDTDYIVGRFATDAENKTFTGDFHFTVQPDYHTNENIIISCRAKYENAVDDSVPDILFRFTNGEQSQYISPRYILGEKGEYVHKEWRIPAFIKNCYLYVDVRIPENVTVYIDEISNRYSGEISRETAGFRMNAHTGVYADFNTLDAFFLSARVGYPCCIVVPKRTSDGVWVCFHDDSNIGERLVDENHDALVEPEYSSSISDITFARLNQLTYKVKNGEYAKVPTLEQFFFVCAKTGMRPMFSWHPVPTVEQMAEVKAMADKFDLLPYLNIKIAFGGADNVTAMNNVHSVFGDGIESYWGDVNVNTDIATIISALDSTNLDKTKTRVGLEIFDNRATIEKVQAVRSAGYLAAIAFMNTNPSSATMESWIKNGVCEFTETRNFSNGLNW